MRRLLVGNLRRLDRRRIEAGNAGRLFVEHNLRNTTMKKCKRIETLIVIVALLSAAAVYVPSGNAQTSAQRATKVRLEMRDIYGALFVTIAGTEKKVTDQAQQAWIINGG